MRDITITDMRVHPGDSGFLIDDGRTAILYDTGFGFTGFAMADKLKARLGSRNLDYIFLTHSHYDHALGSAYILQRFPHAKVVAGSYAKYVFSRPGARATMRRLDMAFAAENGITEYPLLDDALRVDIPVEDGDIIAAGDMRFQAIALPGHTRCCFGFLEQETGLFLSCETLGVYDGKSRIIPSYLVSYRDTLESIRKVRPLPIRQLLAPHFGILDPAQTAFFLENTEKCNVETAEFLLNCLKEGLSDQQIIAQFLDRFCRGYIKTIYPEEAARLNTSIMIQLIRRELL